MTAATVIPTRRSIPRRIAEAVRAAYLRRLIQWHDQDAVLHEWHAEVEPQLAQIARDRAAELRVELARLS